MAITGADYTDITAVASTGLTSNQFYLVKTTGVDSTYSAGNLTCLLSTGSTGGISAVKGVLQNDPDTGQAAIIRVHGLSKVVAGAAFDVGDRLTSDASGLAIKVASTGAWVFGTAESASTASGQIVTARVTEGFTWAGSSA